MTSFGADLAADKVGKYGSRQWESYPLVPGNGNDSHSHWFQAFRSCVGF